jgi:NAD(P)-dependent dehydrogenase (short-subunit alcohol dehydrogenase family)
MGSKIAVVTGAGRGLGRSMARFAWRGVGVVGTFGSENDDGFKSAAAEIEANGGRVAMLGLDVSSITSEVRTPCPLLRSERTSFAPSVGSAFDPPETFGGAVKFPRRLRPFEVC